MEGHSSKLTPRQVGEYKQLKDQYGALQKRFAEMQRRHARILDLTTDEPRPKLSKVGPRVRTQKISDNRGDRSGADSIC